MPIAAAPPFQTGDKTMSELAVKPQEQTEEITKCCECHCDINPEKAYCAACFDDKIIECDKCGNTINQEEERFCDECIGQVKDQLADALRELVDFRRRNQIIMEDTKTCVGKLLAFYNRKQTMMIGNIKTAQEQDDFDIYADIISNLMRIRNNINAQMEYLK